MKHFELLKKLDAFKNLTDSQLSEIRPCCEEVLLKKGERLFAEGEPAHHVWILAEGKVDLKYESDDRMDEFGPEDIHFISEANLFGWSCFVPPYQYYLSGYCDSGTCRFLKIKKEDLILLFEKDERMGHLVMSYILKVVGTHFEQLRDKMVLSRLQPQPVSETSTTEQITGPVEPGIKNRLEIAANLLKLGKLTREEIAVVTGLDLKKVNDLNTP